MKLHDKTSSTVETHVYFLGVNFGDWKIERYQLYGAERAEWVVSRRPLISGNPPWKEYARHDSLERAEGWLEGWAYATPPNGEIE